jgi:hypothetical protein
MGTALAVYWAHQVADRFPDGQLYVNLRRFDPSGSVMASAEAVRRFLDARQGAAGTDPDRCGRCCPGAPTCLVLGTSRNQLTGLIAADGAHPVMLDLLTDQEARQLLVSWPRWSGRSASCWPFALLCACTHYCARVHTLLRGSNEWT